MAKKIIKGLDAQRGIIEGVKDLASAVKVTMGPSGKCVAIENIMTGPEITRDGATVCKAISFLDGAKNMGAFLVRKAASLSEEDAGDSTSTTVVLTDEFCQKGQRALNTGSNVSEIKSGMIKAERWVKDFISKNSIPIDGDLEKIRKVATISANNDPEVGNLIVDSMRQVGIDGVITADLSFGLDTKISVTSGMKLERGWASPHFVTSPADGKCVMEECYVLVCGTKISNVNQIFPLLQVISDNGNKPFLIVCEGMDDIVISTLALNSNRGAITCCVIKDIDFGDGRKNIMQDIATSVGGTYICSDNGRDISEITIDDLGFAKKVIVSRDNTIIYEGAGNPEEIKVRADILRARLSDPSVTQYDKTKFSKRLANLVGGISVIKAGGATEVEKINRKATIEDSILASRSALTEGCVPGCGYIYYKAALAIEKDKAFWSSLEGNEKDGAEIVVSSLPIIMKTVVENAGVSPDIVLDTIKKSKNENWGYNAKSKKFCNLVDDGILDSAKCIRIALENSVSTASMILSTECVALDEDDEKTKAANTPLS